MFFHLLSFDISIRRGSKQASELLFTVYISGIGVFFTFFFLPLFEKTNISRFNVLRFLIPFDLEPCNIFLSQHPFPFHFCLSSQGWRFNWFILRWYILYLVQFWYTNEKWAAFHHMEKRDPGAARAYINFVGRIYFMC